MPVSRKRKLTSEQKRKMLRSRENYDKQLEARNEQLKRNRMMKKLRAIRARAEARDELPKDGV